MIKVKAKIGEPIDMLIRRFKKTCEREGLIKEIKKSAFYEKPSEVRRRKTRLAERKVQKETQAFVAKK